MSAGGSEEPWATAAKAPILSSASFSVEKTSQARPFWSHMALARAAELRGGEDVAGLVDQVAGEVLGRGEDEALVKALADFVLGGSLLRCGDEGKGVDGEILAVAAVGVPVRLGDLGAFDERAGREGAGERVEMLVGECVVFREGEGDVADGTRLGGADGRSGGLADDVGRERVDLAEADEEQALGLKAIGSVQEEGLAQAGLELAGGQDAGDRAADLVRGAEEHRERFCILSFGNIDGKDREQRGLKAGYIPKDKLGIHSLIVPRLGAWEGRLAALTSGDGGLGFAVGLTLALGGALVVLLLAFGESDLALELAVAEVEPYRDEGESLLLGGGFELANLLLVQEKLAGAERLMVHAVAVAEGADVGVEQETLAILEQAVGVLEVGFALADGLDLSAAEGDAGLVFFGKEVVEAGRAVEGGIALAGRDGVAILLLHVRLGLVGGSRDGHGARHGESCKFNMRQKRLTQMHA